MILVDTLCDLGNDTWEDQDMAKKRETLGEKWDNWGDERGCDEGHWHAHARGLLWGLPEVVGTVQQVHYFEGD